MLIRGIACESIETGPFAALAHGWTRAGYDTLRFDKRGVGDSEGGPCRDIDFATELADARAVVAHAPSALRCRVDPFGHSVGGIIATQLAAHADALHRLRHAGDAMDRLPARQHAPSARAARRTRPT